MANGRARRSPRREAKARAPLAAPLERLLAGLDPAAPAEESDGGEARPNCSPPICGKRATTLTRSPPCRPAASSSPGDLEGSPALTFAPLPLDESAEIAPGSLAAMMERRYEAYKTYVARPFFRDHFARLDRQIVLVDALSALNSGPAALRDLENALTR